MSTHITTSVPAASPALLDRRKDDAGSDYARLSRQVKQAGLLNRRPGYYSMRALARWQAWLFWPLLLLEGLNLHVASVRALFDGSRRHHSRAVEAGLLVVHAGGYLTVLFVFLSPWQALAFLAVQQGLFGLYMGASFAPNHKGMPILPAGDRTDYLRRQVLTSRNVRGGPCTDFVLGGLNYQIEHHLFPSMPRPNLRRAQGLVRDYCQRHGVFYREDTLISSYAQTLRHLDLVGQ